MMYSLAVFRAFAGELESIKLAALTPEQAAEFKEHLRQQRMYDQKAAQGGMTEAEKKLHQVHTARVQEYLDKKRGYRKRVKYDTIPKWARDPKGAPPESHWRSSAPAGGAPRPRPGDYSWNYHPSSGTGGPGRGPGWAAAATTGLAIAAPIGLAAALDYLNERKAAQARERSDAAARAASPIPVAPMAA